MKQYVLVPAAVTLALVCLTVIGKSPIAVFQYQDPIDAVSIGVPTDNIDLAISGKTENGWTDWYSLELEKEFDPKLRESNLITFDTPVSAVRVRGSTSSYDVHPIRVSKEPVHYQVAATTNVAAPKILTRAQWGADESFLFTNGNSTKPDVPVQESTGNGDTGNSRVDECETNVKLYPDEFKVARTVTKDSQGRVYRWKEDYSLSIKMLVVHHTALQVTGDSRPAVERIRALYAYHANNRGWGDVGYHYLIDEAGTVYEGRAGGDYVVGGHAYCANVGTIGVALLGNFDIEQPTQVQMKALQGLLKDLADRYKINLNKQVEFHGKMMDPIVGHRDLLSTDCPGYYVAATLDQVRTNVAAGTTNKAIRFPVSPKKTSTRVATKDQGFDVSAVGSTNLVGRPGEQIRLSVLVYARAANLPRRSRVATIDRSDPSIGIWQDTTETEVRVRQELILTESLLKGATSAIRLRLQYPREPGTYTLMVGNIKYTLTSTGRGSATTTTRTTERRTIEVVPRSRPSVRSVIEQATPTRTIGTTVSSARTATIRVRLGYQGDTATIALKNGAMVNGVNVTALQLTVRREGTQCIAEQGRQSLATGVIRIVPTDTIFTVQSWNVPLNRFRGTVECQIIDGQLVLINELPLEDYMKGLAEEPDTEPYEKQRAFAIAARTYAAFYLQPANRKFPGMPYDGDDSPARFQKYSGLNYEEKNPLWLQAVSDTANQVLKKNGALIKPPYFSSDDGRTRSPDEVGWKNFPFAEVFSSKPDPWCQGLPLSGHGVGMSGCGAEGQANEGKTGEQILQYYYPGTAIEKN